MKKKKLICITISYEALEVIRDAAFNTPGMTMSALFEMGALKFIEEMVKANGKQFDKRTKDLKPGRKCS